MTRWEGDKGGRAPVPYRGQESLDREARVLRDWADGWSATDIAIRQTLATRNMAMGIVNRSRGAVAERAKRAHAEAATLRYPKGPRRIPRALREPAQRDRFVSTQALAASLKQQADAERAAVPKIAVARGQGNKRAPLSGQALADRAAKNMAVQRAAIARVELTLIDNPAFVKVEREPDFYAHMRTDRGLSDALAALTRDRKTGEIFHG